MDNLIGKFLFILQNPAPLGVFLDLSPRPLFSSSLCLYLEHDIYLVPRKSLQNEYPLKATSIPPSFRSYLRFFLECHLLSVLPLLKNIHGYLFPILSPLRSDFGLSVQVVLRLALTYLTNLVQISPTH